MTFQVINNFLIQIHRRRVMKKKDRRDLKIWLIVNELNFTFNYIIKDDYNIIIVGEKNKVIDSVNLKDSDKNEFKEIL